MRRSLWTCVLVLGVVACARPDPAVSLFESKLASTATLITNAAAASYIYRLSETPEEQIMQKTMERVGQRRASAADLELAIETERTRRTKYIDGLEEAIEHAHGAVAELSESANAIVDAQVRAAALKIVAHHEEQLQLCSTIARAQRTRSSLTESFLAALVNKTPLKKNDRLPEADANADKARVRLEEIASADQILVAEFRGTKQRRTRPAVW